LKVRIGLAAACGEERIHGTSDEFAAGTAEQLFCSPIDEYYNSGWVYHHQGIWGRLQEIDREGIANREHPALPTRRHGR
jgi:hypothetical protein